MKPEYASLVGFLLMLIGLYAIVGLVTFILVAL